MKQGIRLISLTILLILSIGSVNAAKENHAGTNCVAQAGVDVRYNHDGAVFNNSTAGTAHVFCNFPHTDFDGFLNAGEVDGGWIETVDLHQTQNIDCRARRVTLNSDGSRTIVSSSLAQTTGFGTHRQHDTFGSVGETSNSSYFLNCHIPPRTNLGTSRIFVYQVRQ